LDIFRFVGDIASPGGGLSTAIESRGGISKVRSLFARTHQGGRLIVDLTLEDGEDSWRYRLAVRGEKGGLNRPIVDEELVEKNGAVVLSRPDAGDNADPARLTQTHLEQIAANHAFRALADYFGKVQYFHLVPQIIRDPGRLASVTRDPYGADFIARMNSISTKTRLAWLRRMETALRSAVPEFQTLSLEVDPAGRPHLVAGYKNWRETLARQTEADFSDGTLRLIGLLWTLISSPANGGVLLLEEPELSLNSAIVRMLPTVFATAQRDRTLQVVLSTHAPELLDDEGVLASEILVLQVTADGTRADLLSNIPSVAGRLAAELSHSEVVNSLIAPTDLTGLVSVGRQKR
jgi:predicted ATPase